MHRLLNPCHVSNSHDVSLSLSYCVGSATPRCRNVSRMPLAVRGDLSSQVSWMEISSSFVTSPCLTSSQSSTSTRMPERLRTMLTGSAPFSSTKTRGVMIGMSVLEPQHTTGGLYLRDRRSQVVVVIHGLS